MITDETSAREHPTRSQRLRAALDYARREQPVFPLAPGAKQPVISKCPEAKARQLFGEELAEHARNCRCDGHGVYDATTDPRRITAWFNRFPDANVAIATGRRLLVIDEDPEHGGAKTLAALEDAHGPLPETYTVRTGGGGRHLYFGLPEGVEVRNSAGKLGPGLDVRGDGGYVVAPPSGSEKGRYEVLDDLPLADAPESLLEALREPQSSRTQAAGAPSPVSVDAAGPPILEGTRDDTLARTAGRLHDGTRSLEALVEDLLAINSARCEPPLPERQVEKIATSIHRRQPSRGSSEATPEVLEALDAIEREIDGLGWSETGAHTDYDLMLAACRFARRHGKMIPAGVRVEVSVRELAEAASIGSTKTVVKSIDRLRQAGRLRRDGAGSGPKRGALVLTRAKGNTHPSSGVLREGEEVSVSPCAPPRSADRLRWSAPGYGGRLGKRRGRVVDVLEASKRALTLDELADALTGEDGKRPRERDLRRRTLPPLLAAGVVDCVFGEYRLSDDWRTGLDRRREEDGEIEAARLQRARYEHQREAFREAWACGDVVSKDELARRRRRRGAARDEITPEERHVSGAVAELERVPAVDPALLEALREFLRRNPDRRGERPSWFATALWAENYTANKLPPEKLQVALEALEAEREAA